MNSFKQYGQLNEAQLLHPPMFYPNPFGWPFLLDPGPAQDLRWWPYLGPKPWPFPNVPNYFPWQHPQWGNPNYMNSQFVYINGQWYLVIYPGQYGEGEPIFLPIDPNNWPGWEFIPGQGVRPPGFVPNPQWKPGNGQPYWIHPFGPVLYPDFLGDEEEDDDDEEDLEDIDKSGVMMTRPPSASFSAPIKGSPRQNPPMGFMA